MSEKLAVVKLEGRPARQVHISLVKVVAESFICVGSQSLTFCRLGIGTTVARESKLCYQTIPLKENCLPTKEKS